MVMIRSSMMYSNKAPELGERICCRVAKPSESPQGKICCLGK